MVVNKAKVKKNGRPAVKDDRKKRHRVVIYLDDSEYKHLLEQSERVGMKPSRYARRKLNSPSAPIKERVTVEQMEIYRSLRRDIGPIAHNISRIAKYIKYGDIYITLDQIREVNKHLQKITNNYLKILTEDD